MLTCQQMTELVTSYLERDMRLWTRLRFELHLGMCQHCRRYLRQMRETIAAAGSLPQVEIPEDVRDELMRRFKNWQP